MIGIGIVGYGYWGPNLVRNFTQTEGARVVCVCDQREARRAQVEAHYPSIKTVAKIEDLLADTSIDAVAIATPVFQRQPRAHHGVSHGHRPGHHVVAEGEFVRVLRGGDDPDVLIERCKGKLASFKVPRRVEIVASLPRNALGKVQKHLLCAS